MEISEIELQKIRVAAELAMADCALLEPKLNIEYRPDFKCLVSQINGYVWGQELEAETYSYPATWWDALKANWAPYWFVRRFPVHEKKFRVHFNVMYPNFKMAFPGETTTIKAMVQEIGNEVEK